jgi:predicted alpha/beta-fold hydrolase
MDQDFIDLDWLRIGSNKLALIIHGLESSSKDSSIKGLAKVFNTHGWDSVVMNLRGCSGEPNRLLKSYHAGATEDLNFIIDKINQKYTYKKIHISGFSLGGNQVLKYLGEGKWKIPKNLICASVVSVPCNLKGCAEELAKKSNRKYMKKFFHSFYKIYSLKKHLFQNPDLVQEIKGYKTFKEFDDQFTAPIHGFKDAEDYWSKNSSLQYLEGIKIPTFFLTSRDDPFFDGSCIPLDIAQNHSSLYLEVASNGGHCGFILFNPEKENYIEKRILEFVEEI